MGAVLISPVTVHKVVGYNVMGPVRPSRELAEIIEHTLPSASGKPEYIYKKTGRKKDDKKRSTVARRYVPVIYIYIRCRITISI